MSMPSRDASYFDHLYRNDADPWRFATSAYETQKYAATLEALPDRRFERGLEIGCSIGVFTRALAVRCDSLLAIDISALPLETARKNCADLAHVAFRQCAVPAQFPGGTFDLVLLSEVLYFLDHAAIANTAARVVKGTSPSGSVMLVNWLGPTGAPCTGDEGAELFIAASAPTLSLITQCRSPDYRLDLLTRV